MQRVSTGIKGLDQILIGGFFKGSANLVRGGPGSGKTILGLHFLYEGVKRKENSLFISFGETIKNIRKFAKSLEIDLNNIKILDLTPSPDFFVKSETYDIFNPAEVERDPTTKAIIETIESFKPDRIFIDAVTQFRFISLDNFQFRKQVLSFINYLQQKDITVVFSSESTTILPDDDIQFMVDTVINLESCHLGRYLFISKFRGSDFMNGNHAFKISNKGMEVFPETLPALMSGYSFDMKRLSFGIDELDKLSGGGIETTAINIISGHPGTGKTTLALQFLSNCAKNGIKSVYFSFEEEIEFIIKRCASVKIPVEEYIKNGYLQLVKIEPLVYFADEFSQLLMEKINSEKISVVVIDSISGYKLSLKSQNIVSKLHSLCKSLQHLGITTVLIDEVEDITGNFRITEEHISYLADNIIFLRHLEVNGKLSKAIGVLKKRVGDFEKTLRQFEITSEGIKISEPLNNLRGILLGVPEWVNNKFDE